MENIVGDRDTTPNPKRDGKEEDHQGNRDRLALAPCWLLLIERQTLPDSNPKLGRSDPPLQG